MTNPVITVSSKKQAEEGKKQCSLIDSTGKRWGFYPELWPQLDDFGTYEVLDFSTNQFNGRTYYTLKKVRAVAGAPATATPRTATKLPTAPAGHTEDQRRMDIFVCGAFNNILANSSIDPLGMDLPTMVNLLSQLKKAWKASLGPGNPSSQSLANPDMNDEIPE